MAPTRNLYLCYFVFSKFSLHSNSLLANSGSSHSNSLKTETGETSTSSRKRLGEEQNPGLLCTLSAVKHTRPSLSIYPPWHKQDPSPEPRRSYAQGEMALHLTQTLATPPHWWGVGTPLNLCGDQHNLYCQPKMGPGRRRLRELRKHRTDRVREATVCSHTWTSHPSL